MSAQAKQVTQHMSMHSLSHALIPIQIALTQELFDALEELRRLFFTSIGEGGTLLR